MYTDKWTLDACCRNYWNIVYCFNLDRSSYSNAKCNQFFEWRNKEVDRTVKKYHRTPMVTVLIKYNYILAYFKVIEGYQFHLLCARFPRWRDKILNEHSYE